MQDAKSIIEKVRRIEIKTRRLSDQLFAGEYHSSFKGRGMSFAEVRPYQSGDEVRSIDWNVTARKRAPYIKVFEEERELTLNLVVDISTSMRFGTAERTKAEQLAEIAATLAFSAVGNNDKIGLVLFAGDVEKVIPPGKGRRHVMRIIKTILETEATHPGSNVEAAMNHLLKVQKRHSIVFVLSDFLNTAPDKNYRIAAKRYDLCTLALYDQKEWTLPKVGLLPMKDLESGRVQWVNTSSGRFERELAKRQGQHLAQLEQWSKVAGAGFIPLDSTADFVPPLLQFMKSKGR